MWRWIRWKITYNWFKTLQCDRLPASPCGYVCCFSLWIPDSSINKTSINRQGSDFLLTFFNPVWWRQLNNQRSQFIPLPPWRGVSGSDAHRWVTTAVSFIGPHKVDKPASVSLKLPPQFAPLSPAAQCRPIVAQPNRVQLRVVQLFR